MDDETYDDWPYPTEKMPEVEDEPAHLEILDLTRQDRPLSEAETAIGALSPQFLDQASGIISEREGWPCTREDCQATSKYAAFLIADRDKLKEMARAALLDYESTIKRLEQDLARLRAEKEQG